MSTFGELVISEFCRLREIHIDEVSIRQFAQEVATAMDADRPQAPGFSTFFRCLDPGQQAEFRKWLEAISKLLQ